MVTQGLIDPLQLELFDQMFPFKNNLSYGYNLKNARNEKSRSNNTKMGMPSLGLKSKFKQQFEFSENLEDLYGKYCWSLQKPFFLKILCFKKIQAIKKPY